MVTQCSNLVMIDVAEIRRRNLARLVALHGLASAARRLGRPDRQINDMIVGRKSFGEKVARALEENYAPELPAGWLDFPHETIQDTDRDENHDAAPQCATLLLLANTQPEPSPSKLTLTDRWPLSEEDYRRFAALPPEGRGYAIAGFVAGIDAAETRYLGNANSA